MAVVFALTLGGKFVAFLKDAMVASAFGMADELDVFLLVFGFMAFSITVIAGGLPESFLPAYVALRHRKGARRANRMALQTGLCHFLSLVLAGLVIVLGGHFLIEHLAHGFSMAKRDHAQSMLLRLMPLMICFGMSFHFGAWMRAEKRFFLVAGAPMLVPLTIIAFMVVTRSSPSIDALIYGTNLGAALHCALLMFVVSRQLPGDVRWWQVTVRRLEPAVRLAARKAFPFLVGGFAFSIASVVDQTMASWLPAGSVAVLGYSEKLCGIILGVIAGPAADVLFPYFADHAAKNDWVGLRVRLLKSVGLIVGGALPLVFILEGFAPQIVGLLFERGEFGAGDTQRVAEVLRYGALQIPFYITGILTARVIVSLQASKFMLLMSLGALMANVCLNWLLMGSMGVAGIALSTVFVQAGTALVACTFCFRLFRRKESV